MMDASPALKYTRIAMLLHWLMVVLIAAMFALGWFMVELPKGPARSYYFALHKSLGLCALVLLFARVAWRVKHRPPPLPADLPGWQAQLARAVHGAFYVLLLLQPTSGYLSSSFSGYATHWFGLPLPAWGWGDAPLNQLFTELHVLCSMALLVLIGVHVTGVMSHLLAGERSLIRRMWPW
jgi:cytochrome b561